MTVNANLSSIALSSNLSSTALSSDVLIESSLHKIIKPHLDLRKDSRDQHIALWWTYININMNHSFIIAFMGYDGNDSVA